MKSALFKKPQRKTRFLQYLADYLPANQVKLPPELVKTRWGTWYRTLLYHVHHLQVYESVFRTEAAEGMAIEHIKEILQSKKRFSSLTFNMNYLVENCTKVMNLITLFEGQGPTVSGSL